MQHQINQCNEATKTSGKIVSHFYQFNDSHCVCVFCGKTIHLTTYSEYNSNPQIHTSIVGQRS